MSSRLECGLVVEVSLFEIPLLAEGILARSLLVELPVVRGEHGDALREMFSVVLVGQVGAVAAAAVVGSAVDDPLARRCSEDTCPVRQQPGQVGVDEVFWVRGIEELIPFAREVEWYLGSR